MKLNKKDLYQYRKFVMQMEQGSGDTYLDECIVALIRFINNQYISEESKNFELDDFIQECLMKVGKYRDNPSLKMALYNCYQKTYRSMKNSPDYDYFEPAYIGEAYSEIDDSAIDYRNMLQHVKEEIQSPIQRQVFDYVCDGASVMDISRLTQIRRGTIYDNRKRIIERIRSYPEFQELSDDKLNIFFSRYQAYAITMTRNYYDSLDTLLVQFWNGQLDKRDYYMFCENLIRLLRFFHRLKKQSTEEPYSFYLPCINADIDKIVTIMEDNQRLDDNQRKRFESILLNDQKTK